MLGCSKCSDRDDNVFHFGKNHLSKYLYQHDWMFFNQMIETESHLGRYLQGFFTSDYFFSTLSATSTAKHILALPQQQRDL